MDFNGGGVVEPSSSPLVRSLASSRVTAAILAAPAPLAPASTKLLATPRIPPRRINRVPTKVLDAPALGDDFYASLLDWSSTNVVAVALGRNVYSWNGATSAVSPLVELPVGASASSVAWSDRAAHVAVADVTGGVCLLDAATHSTVRSYADHKGRVGALAWAGPLLATGGKDRAIVLRDVRSPRIAESVLKSAHASDVTGLKWAPDWRSLASGGADHLVHIWDASLARPRGGSGSVAGLVGDSDASGPRQTIRGHRGVVKGLAWSPHTAGLLASGGGIADRSIRITDILGGRDLVPLPVDTGSQIGGLVWSTTTDELASVHGAPDNCLSLWRARSLGRIASLTGHTARVIYLSLSPDGESVVTGAGDESLRFWSVFPSSVRSSRSNDVDDSSVTFAQRQTFDIR